MAITSYTQPSIHICRDAVADRSLCRDIVVQTACAPALDDRPAIGGLLLWQDRRNYIRLDWGMFGKDQIMFSGWMNKIGVIFGRGRLSFVASRDRPLDTAAQPAYLRLERRGTQVHAFCSADPGAGTRAAAAQWYTVGQTELPADVPVQVGLLAMDAERTIYHGAYPEGTAIRFPSFELWEALAT